MFEPENNTVSESESSTISPSTFSSTPPVIRWIGLASVGLIVLVLSVVAYSAYEHSVASRLAAENNQLAALLKDTRSQIDALSARLDALAPVQQPVQEKAKPSVVHRAPSARSAVAHRHAGAGCPQV